MFGLYIRQIQNALYNLLPTIILFPGFHHSHCINTEGRTRLGFAQVSAELPISYRTSAAAEHLLTAGPKRCQEFHDANSLPQ